MKYRLFYMNCCENNLCKNSENPCCFVRKYYIYKKKIFTL
jgi:hypothetical protein